jgi:hypothetical protein
MVICPGAGDFSGGVTGRVGVGVRTGRRVARMTRNNIDKKGN